MIKTLKVMRHLFIQVSVIKENRKNNKKKILTWITFFNDVSYT